MINYTSSKLNFLCKRHFKIKRKATDRGDKYVQITYLTRGYRSKIYKEFSKLNKSSPIKIRSKYANRSFTNGYIWIVNTPHEKYSNKTKTHQEFPGEVHLIRVCAALPRPGFNPWSGNQIPQVMDEKIKNKQNHCSICIKTDIKISESGLEGARNKLMNIYNQFRTKEPKIYRGKDSLCNK